LVELDNELQQSKTECEKLEQHNMKLQDTSIVVQGTDQLLHRLKCALEDMVKDTTDPILLLERFKCQEITELQQDNAALQDKGRFVEDVAQK